MSKIVERVARAISRRFIESNKAAGHPTNLTWRDYVPDAIAAIEAMRVPTLPMLEAFNDAVSVWLDDEDSMDADVWRAMIDAALDGSRPDAG